MFDTIWNLIKCEIDDIASMAEVIGVILVVVTLYRDRKIKKTEFVSEYNFHFISSDPLVEFERKLENCYQKYDFMDRGGHFIKAKKEETKCRQIIDEIDTMMGVGCVKNSEEPVSIDYQQMVNYLVYLESFAPLLLKRRVSFGDVDDIFGYRYFIAMNNPIVQTRELIREAQYYRGCIRLYKRWYRYRIRKHREIPMDRFTLERWDENDPEGMNLVFEMKPYKKLKDDYLKVAYGRHYRVTTWGIKLKRKVIRKVITEPIRKVCEHIEMAKEKKKRRKNKDHT